MDMRREQFRIRVRLECLHLAARLLEQQGVKPLKMNPNNEYDPEPMFVALAHQIYPLVVADGDWWVCEEDGL